MTITNSSMVLVNNRGQSQSQISLRHLPSVTMLNLLFAYICISGLQQSHIKVAAFTHAPNLSHTTLSTGGVILKPTVLHVGSIIPEKEATDTTPSTKFGSPLSDSVKDLNKFAIGFLKGNLFDNIFSGEDRSYARFYALETIARVPYFSYLSVLHLYETLGKWRNAKYLKLHFAESWNEMHHLLIMEELGGNERFADRFVAQHVAFGYFALVVFLYMINPVEAYNLNQEVEQHAFTTYDEYLKQNAELLKTKPAPKAAVDYYIEGDMYMFDEFQTECEMRRPKITNLYDVFVAIRDDEMAHVKTMKRLQTELDYSSMNDGECQVP